MGNEEHKTGGIDECGYEVAGREHGMLFNIKLKKLAFT